MSSCGAKNATYSILKMQLLVKYKLDGNLSIHRQKHDDRQNLFYMNN